MKRTVLILAACILLFGCARSGQAPVEGDGTVSSTFEGTVDFDQYFTPERLRLDFVLAGGSQEQHAYLQEMHRECGWVGPRNGLVDKFGYGQYWFEAFSGNDLVFSKGFCTLFEEWTTTAQASQVEMAATQTIWMPCPKDSIHVVLYRRARKTGMFSRFFECDIDPHDRHINPQPANNFNVTLLEHHGEPAEKVDLLFIAEGYTEAEMDRFRGDAARFTEYLFSMEPYSHRREDFNIWLVESVSEESGVDIPHWDQWRRTVCNSSFDTFYIDRYLTVMDHRSIAEAAACAPFDCLFVIANDTKYGGGGIYNSYAMGTSGHRLSNEVFIHEFGHSFAALGDEYYDSEVAYEDYYPAGVEPWEPNITTLVDFSSKWEDMVEEGLDIPTPNDSAYIGRVGVFEGAGYMTYGCYRPYYECRMLNNTAPGFCPVCQRAIERMIDYYCGK